jgi:hypothetical protein
VLPVGATPYRHVPDLIDYRSVRIFVCEAFFCLRLSR